MNYVDLRDNLVKENLIKYGKTVYIRRPTTVTGWTKTWDAGREQYKWTKTVNGIDTVVYVDPSTASNDIEGRAVEKAYKQTEINGTTVMSGDRRFMFLFYDTQTDVTTADKLVVDSKMLTIKDAQAVRPGSTVLVWILQCRM
jgi:hypothetical protein